MGRPNSRMERSYAESVGSFTPCDFQSGSYLWNDIGQKDGSGFQFTVNNPSGYAAAGANTNFQSGQTIYINVRNYISDNGSNVRPSCPAGQDCDLLFGFQPPRP